MDRHPSSLDVFLYSPPVFMPDPPKYPQPGSEAGCEAELGSLVVGLTYRLQDPILVADNRFPAVAIERNGKQERNDLCRIYPKDRVLPNKMIRVNEEFLIAKMIIDNSVSIGLVTPELVSLIISYLDGKYDSGDCKYYFKCVNLFSFILEHKVYRHSSQFTFENILKLSYLQNDVFDVNIQAVYEMFKSIPDNIDDNLGREFCLSSLALPVMEKMEAVDPRRIKIPDPGVQKIFAQCNRVYDSLYQFKYRVNPLSFYVPGLREEELRLLMQVIRTRGTVYNNQKCPPPIQGLNPRWDAVPFTDGHEQSVLHYIVQFDLFKELPDVAFPFSSLLIKNSQGIYPLSFLKNLTDEQINWLIVNHFKKAVYRSNNLMDIPSSEATVCRLYVQALEGLDANDIAPLEKYLKYLSDISQVDGYQPTVDGLGYELYLRAIQSNNSMVIQLIRNQPFRVFKLFSGDFFRRKFAHMEATARAIFLSLPIDHFLAAEDKNPIYRFIYESYFVEWIIGIVDIWAKGNLIDSLFIILRKFHEFMSMSNPLAVMCGPSLNNEFELNVARYWARFPGQLFDSSLRKTLHGICRNTPLYNYLSIKTNSGAEYRLTLIHYFVNCSISKYSELPARSLPRELSIFHQVAGDEIWKVKDSNGMTVVDIALTCPELLDWLRRLIPEKERQENLGIPVLPNSVKASPAVANSRSNGIVFITNSTGQNKLTGSYKKELLKEIQKNLAGVMDQMKLNLNGAISENLIDPSGALKIEVEISSSQLGTPSMQEAINFLFRALTHRQETLSEDVYKNFVDFDPNQQLLRLETGSLSSRQRDEVVGAVYKLKQIELFRLSQIKKRDLETITSSIMEALPGFGVRKIPLLVIRQFGHLYHAEVVVGYFSRGNRLLGVVQDSNDEMSQKVKSIVGVEGKFSTLEEGDRIVTLSVEGMDLLTGYMKSEKGLNLLVLPRAPEPEAGESAPTIVPSPVEVLPRVEASNDSSMEDSPEALGQKRGIIPKLLRPKRQKLDVADMDLNGESTSLGAKVENGAHSIGGVNAGKIDKDFDEVQESNKGKRKLDDSDVESLFIPRGAAKKLKEECLVAMEDDPVAYLKDIAFQLIHDTIQGVKTANTIFGVNSGEKKIEFPIEDKLLGLNPCRNPFVFSKLYPYQEADLKKILMLQAAKIYPLISYRMGLGKTYVYVELILQQLVQNPKGRHLVVVPKSVLPQAVSDIHKGLMNGKATAWLTLWKSDPNKASNVLEGLLRQNPIDYTNFVPLLPSLDLIPKGRLNKFLLGKVLFGVEKIFGEESELYDLVADLEDGVSDEKIRMILEEAKNKVVAVENKMEISPNGLDRLAQFILIRSDAVVPIESTVKLKGVSPLLPGQIVVTKYHQIANLSEFEGADQLDSLTLDEAQKVNREGSELNKSMSALIRKQTKANFTPNIVTATPFENELRELWTLIALANRNLFPAESYNALEKYVKLIDNLVANILKTDGFDVSKAIQIFVEYYRLKKILEKAVVYLSQKEAAKKYGTLFPTPIKERRSMAYNQSEAEKINALTDRFASKEPSVGDKTGFFEFLTGISKILTHHTFTPKSSFSIKAGIYTELQRRIESGEVDQVIAESFMLRGLFDWDVFESIFTENKKALLIVDHIVTGELIRLAANMKHGNYCNFYEGRLTGLERDKMVGWFKDKEQDGGPRLLILSIEAGGVGLNLPEADLVINMSKSFNPWAIKQARDRAFRSGHSGEKPVYHLDYAESLFSLHLQTIHKIKKLWVKGLFKNQPDLKAEFALWMNARVAEAARLVLISTKDIRSFHTTMEEIKGRIDEIVDGVDEAVLREKIAAVLPLYIGVKKFPVGDFQLIPMPIGFSREEVAIYAYSYQVKSEDSELIRLRNTAYGSWNVRQKIVERAKFREPEKNGLMNYRGYIQAVIVRMRALNLVPEEVYDLAAISDSEYECSSWPSFVEPLSPVRLYKRVDQRTKQTSYDVIVSKM